MEFVRSMLASGRETGPDANSPKAPASGATPSSGCPFSAVANLAAQRPAMDGESGNRGIGESGQREQASSSPDGRVPSGCDWSPEAERRLGRIPEFIRPMARLGIEHFAAQRGYRRITEDVMEEARGALGM
jgi:hypothetical protein